MTTGDQPPNPEVTQKVTQHVTSKRKRSTWVGDPADFKFTRAPATVGEFDAICAARDYIEKIQCVDLIYRMTDRGRSAPQIVAAMQELRGRIEKGPATILRYVQLYQRFCLVPRLAKPVAVSPLSLPEVAAVKKEESVAVPSASITVMGRGRRPTELDWHEDLIQMQRERVLAERQIELKVKGFSSRRLTANIQTLSRLIVDHLNMRADLGEIERVPVGFDVHHRADPGDFDFSALNEPAKERVLKVMTRLMVAAGDKKEHS